MHSNMFALFCCSHHSSHFTVICFSSHSHMRTNLPLFLSTLPSADLLLIYLLRLCFCLCVSRRLVCSLCLLFCRFCFSSIFSFFLSSLCDALSYFFLPQSPLVCVSARGLDAHIFWSADREHNTPVTSLLMSCSPFCRDFLPVLSTFSLLLYLLFCFVCCGSFPFIVESSSRQWQQVAVSSGRV